MLVCHQEELENVGRLQEVNRENASLRQENTTLRAALSRTTPHAHIPDVPVGPNVGALESLPRNLGSAFTLAAQQSDSSGPLGARKQRI